MISLSCETGRRLRLWSLLLETRMAEASVPGIPKAISQPGLTGKEKNMEELLKQLAKLTSLVNQMTEVIDAQADTFSAVEDRMVYRCAMLEEMAERALERAGK